MNKKSLYLIVAACLAFLATVLAIFIFLKPDVNMGGKIRVTTSAAAWGDIAKQIGGDHVQVTALLSDASADPHLFESGARDTSKITNSDLAIVNGLGYDDFMDKALETKKNDKRAYVNVAAVLNAGENANPHLWYDIPQVHLVAGEIAKKLSEKDPENQADYKKNLAIFVDSLQPLIARLDDIRTNHPRAPIAYTERVAGYIVTRTNLAVLSPETFATAIEEGNEPSPSDQTAMRDLITKKQIKALIYNEQAESEVTKQLRDLADQNKIPVVAMGETPVNNMSYQQWQGGHLESLARALSN